MVNHAIYNANTALYMDYTFNPPSSYSLQLDNNNTSWTLTSVSNLFFLGSPRDTSTPYQAGAFNYLTASGSSVVMNPYNSNNSLLTMAQDINGYWLMNLYNSSTTVYLSCNSSGVLSFSSTLNDQARWTRASDGTNYKFNNKYYSTLYLQAMANGNLVQASAYNGSFANQYDWQMTSPTVVSIGINGVSGQYIAYNSSGPFLGDDNGTGLPINAIYYWIQRPITGSSTNFYYESVSNGGTYITADGIDGVPVFNGGFEYDDQTTSVQNWQLQ